jgi:hypothetical protein
MNPHPSRRTQVVTYRVKLPVTGFENPHAIEDGSAKTTIIPAGSTVEWQPGNYVGRLAIVWWLRRRILVTEADLFANCEIATKSPH